MSTAPKQYRKKPVVIEAREVVALRLGFSVMRYLDKSIALADWCGGLSYMMTQPDERAFADAPVVGPYIAIPTLEGTMAALPGDYIIRGVQGEFYPCKPDIFKATYEEVTP